MLTTNSLIARSFSLTGQPIPLSCLAGPPLTDTQLSGKVLRCINRLWGWINNQWGGMGKSASRLYRSTKGVVLPKQPATRNAAKGKNKMNNLNFKIIYHMHTILLPHSSGTTNEAGQ